MKEINRKQSFADGEFVLWDKVFRKIILFYVPDWIKPNYITIIRFILLPFILFFVIKEKYLTALVCLIIGAMTDALDGAMARIKKEITDWGTVYDPLADKLLIVIFLFLIYRELGLAITILLLFPEVLIIFISLPFLYFQQTQIKIRSNLCGKIKIGAQILAIILLLISLINGVNLIKLIAGSLFYLSVFFAFLSLFFQIKRYKKGQNGDFNITS